MGVRIRIHVALTLMPTVLQSVQSKVDSAPAEGRVRRNENLGWARAVVVEKLISIDRRSAEYKYIYAQISEDIIAV